MFARMFREIALAAARVSRARRTPQIDSIVLATAMAFVSFGGAQAQTATSLVISSSPISSVFGQSVTFTVTISSATGTGTPTGTVTFSDGVGTIGSMTAVAGAGTGQAQATLTTTSLPVGNLTITATYGGDNNFSGSSISTPFSVSKANAGTGIESSGSPSTFGRTVTFTAIVDTSPPSTATPTGTVTFSVNGTSIANVMLTPDGSGVAVVIFSTNSLPIGNDTVTASFNGDSNFNGGSSGSFVETIDKAPTSIGLVSSQNPSTSGQGVILTATVSSSAGNPTGSVTFTDQSTNLTLATVPLNNRQAVFSISTLTPVTHNIQASYSGDNNFTTSSTNLNQIVDKANSAISLLSSPNPSQAGQLVRSPQLSLLRVAQRERRPVA
jgi:large repetitive protein